ncbi:MAG: hypothetical protein Q9206_000106 [Seirophora lacunosa]
MATMMMNLSPTFIRQRLTLPLSSLNIPPLHLLISLFTSSGPICPPHNQNFICIATPTHSPNPTTEPASVTSVMSSAPRMEARLLHLYTSTKSSTGLWQLSHLTCCGMPTDPDMTRVNEPFAIGKTYCLSFLEVPPARGYGNLCFMDSSGPFVRDSKTKVESEAARDAGKIVGRKGTKLVVITDMKKKGEENEWIHTPH